MVAIAVRGENANAVQKDMVLWAQEPNGRELIVASKSGREDMDVAMGWSRYGPGKKAMPERRQIVEA